MASGPASDGAEPTVIVDDLHVVYRVYGAGGDKGTAATALMRVIKRQRRPSVREVHAIRGISFVINHGDAVGIIGRNGSGKSTLLQAIAGLLPPEQGCVYSSGQAALLGVNAALLDDLTGERNVVLGCLAMGMTPQETKDRYQSIVDFSGVGNFIDYPMRTYSTGMAQRLRFSIASAKNHEILMIDEALATGDANFRAKSHERIVGLRGEAGTVFLVAHNLAEIEASCNRVIWLEKGQIMRQGYDVPAIVDAYLEATGGEPRKRDKPQQNEHSATALRGHRPESRQAVATAVGRRVQADPRTTMLKVPAANRPAPADGSLVNQISTKRPRTGQATLMVYVPPMPSALPTVRKVDSVAAAGASWLPTSIDMSAPRWRPNLIMTELTLTGRPMSRIRPEPFFRPPGQVLPG